MTQIVFSELNDYLLDKLSIVGADECGWGSNAGPLVVCAVKAPKNWDLIGLNDSKKISAKKRETMQTKLLQLVAIKEIEYAIASRSNIEIDTLGAAPCLRACYEEVFIKLSQLDSVLITDGNLKFDNLASRGYQVLSLIKGDTLVPAIMAASILGKTFRDAQMKELHQTYPNYGWDDNAGYPTAKHIAAIKKYGFSPLHRKSYKVKALQ